MFIMDSSTDLNPPKAVQGLKSINPEIFRKTCCLQAIKILSKYCSICVKKFKAVLLWRSRLKNIHSLAGSSTHKVILCDPTFIKTLDDFTTEQKDYLKQWDAELQSYTLELKYENFTMDQVLKAVLPESTEDIPTAFETIGHIAHLNLRDWHEPYKEVIGRVILDKNAHIRTVVNKTSTIEETFRFFKMELLSGEDDMNAVVKEHGCTFKFDFSKVYWNSRLQTEHHRITSILKKEDVLFDIFAGVGPFAIPAGKIGCRVFANDLNEHSYGALKKNVIHNKVEKHVACFNLDGRDFINLCFNSDQITNLTPSLGTFTGDVHVVMNLPAIAIEFLDTFANLILQSKLVLHGRTFIHCYCFSKDIKPEADAVDRVKKQFSSVDICDASAYRVRDVAPQKTMICVTFRLPTANQITSTKAPIVGDRNETRTSSEEPVSKIRRLDNDKDLKAT